MQAVLQVAPERLSPPRKGKKVASSANSEAARGAADGGTTRDGDPSSSLKGRDEEPAATGNMSPPVPTRSEEVAELAIPKDGPPATAPGVPVFHRTRGGSGSPLQLKVPWAMPVAKRQRLVEPAQYASAIFAVLLWLRHSSGSDSVLPRKVVTSEAPPSNAAETAVLGSLSDHQVVPPKIALLITGKNFCDDCFSRAPFHLLACVCFAAVEVTAGPLSGPLASLGAARNSSDVATPEVMLEVMLPRGGRWERLARAYPRSPRPLQC